MSNEKNFFRKETFLYDIATLGYFYKERDPLKTK